MSTKDRKISDNSWKIDFGKLLSCAVDGDMANVKEAIIVGSKPTQKDSLWKAMAKLLRLYFGIM